MRIVVIVVDSLRADRSGPTLDRVRQEGCSFDRTYCSGSWTIPSLTAMDTGANPHRLGVCNWRHLLPPGTPSLLAAMPSHVAVPNPSWAFAGWPVQPAMTDSQDVPAVCAAIREAQDGYVLVHHWFTHFPYITTQKTWSGRRHAAELGLDTLHRSQAKMAPRFRSLYQRSVTHFSEEVLPRYIDAATAGGSDTIIVVTSDHGENWGESLPEGRRIEHIYDLHGRWLDDATTHVPLIFWGNGVAACTPDGFARGVDLAPTLADLAGVDWPGSIDGISLARSVRQGVTTGITEALTVSSQNTHTPEVYPVDGRSMWRGFSLRTDDGRETWDAVTDGYPCRMCDLWQTSRGPVATRHRPGRRGIDQAQRRRLRLMGYLE